MQGSNGFTLSRAASPRTVIFMALLSLLLVLPLVPASHARPFFSPTTTVCPNQYGGTLVPPGATFTDPSGHTWLAPSGAQGGGAAFDTFGVMTSYFFPGSMSSTPAPMLSGFGGVFGTYNGQQGWIVTDYCETITLVPV